MQLEAHIQRLWPYDPLFMHCAEKFRQSTDIVHSIFLIVEKSLDTQSRGCIVEGDLEQYYDKLDSIDFIENLKNLGVPEELLCAAVRFQLLPGIRFEILGRVVMIYRRTRGTLTGTRTAGKMGSMPIKDALTFNREVFKQLAYELEGDRFSGMSFVDNIYMPGNTVVNGVSAMRTLEGDLMCRWHLNFGEDSKSVMPARYNADAMTTQQDDELEAIHKEYLRVDTMKAMGCHVGNTGSIAADYEDLEAKLWKAFFANSGSAGARKLPKIANMRMLDRSCRSLVAHRVSHWPYQPHYAQKIGTLQNQLIADILNWRKRPSQTPADFSLKRAKEAAKFKRYLGAWSKLWADRVVTWNQHITDDAAKPTPAFPGRLLKLRNSQCFEDRRNASGTGRPQTRSRAFHHTHVRWEEGLAKAKLRRLM